MQGLLCFVTAIHFIQEKLTETLKFDINSMLNKYILNAQINLRKTKLFINLFQKITKYKYIYFKIYTIDYCYLNFFFFIYLHIIIKKKV